MAIKIAVATLFVLTYVLIIVLPKYKLIITASSLVSVALTCLISKTITAKDLFLGIDFNVILMLVGVMLTVGVFADSNMPNKIAEKMISKTPNSLVAIILLAVLSGFISAFIDNVATVLMLAPIGLAVAKKIDISPVPVIISIAVSSNLQGAATLVGDTTSVMLGSFANMSFFDFFFLNGKFSIFWAVELGAVLTIPVLLLLFRKDKKKLLYKAEEVKVKSIVPSVLLLLNLALLIGFSFLKDKPNITNGIICMGIGLIAYLFSIFKLKNKPLKIIVKSVDYESVLFLIMLFMIIACVVSVGIIDDIANVFIKLGNTNVFLLYTVIVFGSVLISAFIDNIPYVATMLPVIATLSAGLPNVSPYLLYFGLLCGATLGGNLTPIGASANIMGIGILKQKGYEVKAKDFLRIGVPFTLVAVLSAYAFVWFIWGM